MLEVHLSAQGNRLNRVVQALAVISVLFLPMTLWDNIYGTNFETFTQYRWAAGVFLGWAADDWRVDPLDEAPRLVVKATQIQHDLPLRSRHREIPHLPKCGLTHLK